MLVAIDTSGIAGAPAVAAAVFDESGRLIVEDRQDVGAEGVLKLVTSLVQEVGTLSDIRRIAVGQGPGSFTGIRIGISLAQGMAFGLGVPLIPVPLLFAYASRLFLETRRSSVCVSVETSPSDRYMATFQFDAGAITETVAAQIVSSQQDQQSVVLGPELNRATLIGSASRHVIQTGEPALGVVVPIYGKPVNARTILERAADRASKNL